MFALGRGVSSAARAAAVWGSYSSSSSQKSEPRRDSTLAASTEPLVLMEALGCDAQIICCTASSVTFVAGWIYVFFIIVVPFLFVLFVYFIIIFFPSTMYIPFPGVYTRRPCRSNTFP